MNSKSLISILKYGLSIGILYWLYSKYQSQFDNFFETEKQYGWLVMAGLTITLAFFSSYIRWYKLANAINLKLSIADATKLGFIGAFFNVVAFGVVGGDSLRAYYAARHSPDRVPEAILSVFIDRFIGLMVMFGFAATAWFLNQQLSPGLAANTEMAANSVGGSDVDLAATQAAIGFVCKVAGVACVVGVSGLLAFVFFPGMKNFGLFQWFQRLPKIGPLIERGLNAAALYSKNKSVLAIAAGLSLFTNLLFALTIYLVALAISPECPTLPQHLVIAPISMVANSIPLPGGVGGMETALATLYSGYSAPNGFVVALGYRLCILLVSLIGWFVWLRFDNRAQVEANKPQSE